MGKTFRLKKDAITDDYDNDFQHQKHRNRHNTLNEKMATPHGDVDSHTKRRLKKHFVEQFLPMGNDEKRGPKI